MPDAENTMPQPGDATPAPSTVTRLEKRWFYRMLIISLAFAGFGIAGLYDATISYPDRGRLAADQFLLDVLKMKFEDPAFRSAEVGTMDPKAEFERLAAKMQSKSASEFDTARYLWLEALSRIGRLNAAHTAVADPLATRQSLEAAAAKLSPGKRASPLSPWDLPCQWLIFVASSGVAIWIAALLFIVGSRKYTWDPAAKRLGLPGGHSLTPADIAEFDKRKWHKFIVFIRVKPEHATLGGKNLKLDLYCHTDLESWVVEMEKVVNPTAAEATPAPAPGVTA